MIFNANKFKNLLKTYVGKEDKKVPLGEVEEFFYNLSQEEQKKCKYCLELVTNPSVIVTNEFLDIITIKDIDNTLELLMHYSDIGENNNNLFKDLYYNCCLKEDLEDIKKTKNLPQTEDLF